EVVPIPSEMWTPHPRGDDLAIAGPILLPKERFASRSISRDSFITAHDLEEYNVGPGDEVFLVGRFVSHDGQLRNTPVVRVGSIAMMPGEPVRQELRSFDQLSYLIEARSLSGFSGSPVLLYIPPFSHR